MKKLLSILILALLTVGALNAQPRFLADNNPGGAWGPSRPR